MYWNLKISKLLKMKKITKNYLIKIIIGLLLFTPVKAQFDINARTVILQDYLSGEILYEKEADLPIFPASMTKIMTSIIAFELLQNGDLGLEDKFIVSENAWRLSEAGYSSMFIMVGDEISVENLLRGIIVASGNDACIALAEGIAGTEEEFAIMMTTKAKEMAAVFGLQYLIFEPEYAQPGPLIYEAMSRGILSIVSESVVADPVSAIVKPTEAPVVASNSTVFEPASSVMVCPVLTPSLRMTSLIPACSVAVVRLPARAAVTSRFSNPLIVSVVGVV